MSEMFELDLRKLPVPDDKLPDPDNISYYVLEHERKIYLDTDIDEYVMELHRMILRWNMEDKGKPVEERTPIRLYIMSYGGDLDYMWAIVDAINVSVTPVYTINIGVCASAASLIFMAGHKRLMLPTAKVLIHEGSAQIGGDAQKTLDAADTYKKQIKQMKDFILQHSQIPQAQLNKKRNNDWTIDAQQCLEYKICDQIVSLMDEII